MNAFDKIDRVITAPHCTWRALRFMHIWQCVPCDIWLWSQGISSYQIYLVHLQYMSVLGRLTHCPLRLFCFQIGIFRSCYENGLLWISWHLTDDKSILVQVIAWCHQATNHYLSQYWSRPMPPYGVPRPQRVDIWGIPVGPYCLARYSHFSWMQF